MERERSWVLIPLLGALAGCAPASAPKGAASGAAALFDGNCSACHQPGGQGIPGVYPSLAGSPTVTGDPGSLTRWVVQGKRAPTMPPGRYSTVMPQFEWLKDADTAALLTYLRSSFGNHAAAVDAATVAKALGE